MKKLIPFVVALSTFSGCMTSSHGTGDVIALKSRSIASTMQSRELELAKAKNRTAEIELEKARKLAEIEAKKKRELAEIEARKERELAEVKAKAEQETLAQKKRLEELRVQRLEHLKNRYSLLIAEIGVKEPDFQTEIAWAERPFVGEDGIYATDTGNISAQNGETRLRAEYARLLRIKRDGLQLTQADWTNIVVGAVAVGRVNVLGWAFPHVMDIDIVSELDSRRRTPLLWALGDQNSEILDCVWNSHPSFDICDANGATPLHYAVRRGSLRDVDRCLTLMTNMVNVADSNGETPIYAAISLSRLDLVEKLIEAKARMDIKRKDGLSPFAYACVRGELAVLELLERHGANPTADDFTKAIRHGHLEIVKWFVEKMHFSVNDRMVLAISPKDMDLRVREYLLKRGCVLNVDASGGTKGDSTRDLKR